MDRDGAVRTPTRVGRWPSLPAPRQIRARLELAAGFFGAESRDVAFLLTNAAHRVRRTLSQRVLYALGVAALVGFVFGFSLRRSSAQRHRWR